MLAMNSKSSRPWLKPVSTGSVQGSAPSGAPRAISGKAPGLEQAHPDSDPALAGSSPHDSSAPGTLPPASTINPAGQNLGAYSDEDLISAVLAGHDRVTAELYSRLVGVIDKSLYRVFGRREVDHDDLVQTTFEQVVLTLTRGSYARNCSLKTWAARISVNVGLNALRSRRRERRVLDRSAEYPGECAGAVDVERQSAARAALQVVMGELAEMNPRRAQAVFLHDVQGYDLTEVAAMTEVSVTAAQSRLVRGRRELLKRLDSQQKRAGSTPLGPPFGGNGRRAP